MPESTHRARTAARRRTQERLVPSGELLASPDSSMLPEDEGVPPVQAPPTLPPDLQPTEAQAPPTPEAVAPPDPEPTPQADPPPPAVMPPEQPTPEPSPPTQ